MASGQSAVSRLCEDLDGKITSFLEAPASRKTGQKPANHALRI